jgi:hypothetical protein
MSGFETVVLADVKQDKPAAVPALGDVTFELLPKAEVRVNKFTGQEELNLAAAIAEGEYKGRWVYFRFKDPTQPNAKSGKSQAWAAQAMKKLEIALGVDSNDSEAAVDYFNRVASSGSNRFGAALVPETRYNAETESYEDYTREGEEYPRGQVSLFSFHAAA